MRHRFFLLEAKLWCSSLWQHPSVDCGLLGVCSWYVAFLTLFLSITAFTCFGFWEVEPFLFFDKFTVHVAWEKADGTSIKRDIYSSGYTLTEVSTFAIISSGFKLAEWGLQRRLARKKGRRYLIKSRWKQESFKSSHCSHDNDNAYTSHYNVPGRIPDNNMRFQVYLNLFSAVFNLNLGVAVWLLFLTLRVKLRWKKDLCLLLGFHDSLETCELYDGSACITWYNKFS